MRKKRLTKKQILEAISGSKGLLINIAKRLNVSRTTIRNYLDADPELEQAYRDECENILDYAESKLFQKIQEEELKAITFLLARKGKHRGYNLRDDDVKQEDLSQKDSTSGLNEANSEVANQLKYHLGVDNQ